jgi:hypothetical protein
MQARKGMMQKAAYVSDEVVVGSSCPVIKEFVHRPKPAAATGPPHPEDFPYCADKTARFANAAPAPPRQSEWME